MSNVFEIVQAQEQNFNSAVTDTKIVWQKEYMFACQSLASNNSLAGTALANPASLSDAIINVASIGISLNPALKHAYLVPRKKTVCLDISYRGLIHMAVKSGAILLCEAKCVYKEDTYRNTGPDTKPIHEYNAFSENRIKANMVGVYCTAKIPSGEWLTTEMTMAEVLKIQDLCKASGADTPWVKWFEQMSLKSVIKRASSRWVANNDQLARTVDYLNDVEGNKDIKDITPTTDSETLNQLIDAPKKRIEDFVLEASNARELKEAGNMIAGMSEGEEKELLKSAWHERKSELINEGSAA